MPFDSFEAHKPVAAGSPSFFAQCAAGAKKLLLLRVRLPVRFCLELFLPVVFVALLVMLYQLIGGVGDPLPPLRFVQPNQTIAAIPPFATFCRDPDFSGTMSTVVAALDQCPEVCGGFCSDVGPERYCRLLTTPGACSVHVSMMYHTACSMPFYNALPVLVESFDVQMMIEEVMSCQYAGPSSAFSGELSPFGLIAVSAPGFEAVSGGTDGTPNTTTRRRLGGATSAADGDGGSAVAALLRQLNASHPSWWALNSADGAWRTLRANATNATAPTAWKHGIEGAPHTLVFPSASDALDFVIANEGAVYALIDIHALHLGDGDTPPTFDYSLRFNISSVPLTEAKPTLTLLEDRVSGCKYAHSGFLALQTALDSAFTALATANAPPAAVTSGGAAGGGGGAGGGASGGLLGGPLGGGDIVDPDEPFGAVSLMPLDTRYDSTALSNLSIAAGLMFMLGFFFLVQNNAISMVVDKETGTKEASLMMGMRRTSYYTAFLLVSVGLALITSILCALVLHFWMFTTVSFVFLFVSALGYALGAGMFSFLMSCFFRTSKIANLIIPVVYSLLVLLVPSFIDNTTVRPVIVCFPMYPWSKLLEVLLRVGQRHLPLSLTDLNHAPDLLWNIIHLYIIFAAYFLIGVYLDHVLPTASGAPLHPLFFLSYSYWVPSAKRGGVVQPLGASAPCLLVEPLSPDLRQKVVLEIDRLTKTFTSGWFGRGKVVKAVDGLSLDVCEGQITILLGHNGAGKTTTVSMLTGLLPVTSGDATVYGHSIVSNMTAVRQDIGLCPQQNILWPSLTVREHLDYYAATKGVASGERSGAVMEMATRLGLADKINARAESLSGGQKRKLCVAMALIGGSKVVFLDEPTAGMDVQARLAMWEMLQAFKGDRVILMSTHYMDEAEQLGDRIALMSRGKLHSCGSPLYLKQRLGVGYHLSVSMDEPASLTSAAAAAGGAGGTTVDGDVEVVHVDGVAHQSPQGRGRGGGGVGTSPGGRMGVSAEVAAAASAARAAVAERKKAVVSLVRSHAPEAEVVTDVGCELRLRLPLERVSAFGTLFDDFDRQKGALKVRSYAIAPTTMEEVFLRVAAEEEEAAAVEARGAVESPTTAEGGDTVAALAPPATAGAAARGSVRGKTVVEVADECVGTSVGTSLKPSSPSYGAAGAGGAVVPPNGAGAAAGAHYEVPLVAAPNLTRGNPDMSALAQLKPLLMKRVNSSRRDKQLICCTILMPLIFCALLTFLVTRQIQSPPSLAIWPEESEVVVAGAGVSRDDGGVSDTYPFSSDPYDVQTTYAPANVTNTSAVSELLLRQFDMHKRERAMAIVFSDTFVRPVAGSTGPIPGAPSKKGNPPSGPVKGGPVPTPTPTPTTQPKAGRGRSGEVAAEAEGKALKVSTSAIVNTSTPHAAPGAFTFAHNWAVNATYSGTLKKPPILIRSHPLPVSKYIQERVDQGIKFTTGLTLMIPFLVLPATYGARAVMERQTKAKLLQFISGASTTMFWLSFMIVDLVLYSIAAGVALIAFVVLYYVGAQFAAAYVETWEAMLATLALIGVFGLVALPWSYVCGFFFDKQSTAGAVLTLVGILIGLILNIVVFVLRFTVSWWEPVSWISRLAPHFNLGDGFIRMSLRIVVGSEEPIWSWNDTGILQPLLALCVLVPVWWFALLLVESGVAARVHGLVQRLGGKLMKVDGEAIAQSKAGEDEDVAAERAAVKSGTRDNDRLRVLDLVKVFGATPQSKKVAVGGVTFGVRSDEVFAFLGTNGAGKTTTMSMLCGEFPPSYGTGYIDGYDVATERDMARKNMGYCPQFDALIGNLTPDEHLDLYGGLRGLTSSEIAHDRDTLFRILGLNPHREKVTSALSGGNKRRLSIAMALIGAPAVIFLDEPSAGLDPVARRSLWDALGSLTRGCSVVLTTHHLEEVEALAQRVAIMVDGRLVCLGPLSHLKRRFGKGYEVQLSCPSDAASTEATADLMRRFPGSSVVAVDGTRRTVEVPGEAASLGALFRAVEEIKAHSAALDFAVGQTSLEQVFVRVSRNTEESQAAGRLRGGGVRGTLSPSAGACAAAMGGTGGATSGGGAGADLEEV